MAATYRQRASSYEDEDRYANRYTLQQQQQRQHNGSHTSVNNISSTVVSTLPANNNSNNLYSPQDLHRFSQNADRFSTNVRKETDMQKRFFFLSKILIKIAISKRLFVKNML